ncbi:hypothetical protein [Ornithinimicrobium kibberense]|uniref:hypothetical protein n=1 Tax=Ornithinimicrobium kibberense TaxID=282060 RepID=UPI003618E695
MSLSSVAVTTQTATAGTLPPSPRATTGCESHSRRTSFGEAGACGLPLLVGL